MTMEKGEIKNKPAVKAFFLTLTDGKYLIEADDSKERTGPQNKYLHGTLIPEFRKALNGVGYDEVKTDVQAKRIMKSMFLTREIINPGTNETISYVQGTHELSTVEMIALVEEVIKFAAEHMSYEIPFPNEPMLLNHF